MLHHILQDSVRDIADEEIMLRMAVWKEGRQFRVISYHLSTFVFSVTKIKIRVISY